MPLLDDFLEILACPETKAPVVQEDDWLVSTDPKTRRRYPIKDDIPVMMIEESEVMDEEEWRDVMKRHGVQVD